MARDDRPEAVGLREIRRAFVHQAGGAVLQRAVDDVAVAGDPSDVGGAPVGVLVLQIENPFGGEVSADGISAGGVHDAFGLAGRAGRIEDVERMLGIERLGRAHVGRLRHQLVPPVIAACLHVDGSPGAFVDDDVLHAGTRLQRFFDRGEQFHFGAAAVRSVLRDDAGGLRVVNAIDQALEENPPKTIVCGAPMRAQASMATGSSGVMPM